MSTKNKKYGFKRFLIGGMLALTVFSTSFITANLSNLNLNGGVYASYQEVQSSISNSDFSSVSTSSDPYVPNNWTFTNPLKNENIKYGVINTYDTVFPTKADKYGLTTNPGTPAGDATSENDPLYRQLMINSNAGFSRAGYASTSFTLSANSYYSIEVIVKTTDKSKAGIYLNGLSKTDVNAAITNITTMDNWDAYTLFIETNDFVSENVTLELWLGGQEENNTAMGAALFNKVTLKKYSKITYDTIIKESDTKKSNIISLKNKVYIENPIENAGFNITSGDANAITGWKLLNSAQDDLVQEYGIIDTESYNAANDTEVGIKNPETNQMSNDTKVLYVNNKSDSKFGIESTSFNLPQSELYRLTVWTKSDCGVGAGATLKLLEVNPDDTNKDFEPTTTSITCATSVSSNSATSNWTMNTFFLEGHPLKDTQVKIQIWLGETEATSGYVFVDDITLEKVSYSIKESAGSAGTVYSYNSNNTGYNIENGNFNITQKPETELTYPLTPTSWTLSSTDTHFDISESVSGVINTNTSKFDVLKNYANGKGLTVINPGLTPNQKIDGATVDNSSNNVLMLGNPVQTTQTYKSPNFSLSASSYYKLNFLVNTQYATPVNNNGNYGISVKVNGTNYTLFNRNNISTNGEWVKYSIYFNTGSTANETSSIELTLNNIQGFAFFDDVKLETSNEAEFNASKNVNTENTVDFSKESFSTTESNSNEPFKEIYNWQGKNVSETGNVKFGVVDTTKNLSSVLPDISNIASEKNKNILMMYSGEDTNYTASSLDKFNLSVNEFYKITVGVKTFGITQTEQNHKYDKDNKLIDFGVSIGLNGFDKKFTGINTELDDVNGYATYTFYVTPDNGASTYLELSLGNTENLVSGYAFFDSVKFETIDEATYKQAQTDFKDNKMNLVLNELTKTDESDKDGDDFTGSQFDWVIVPSLLLALAIIIALVGTAVRQFKFTKKPKIKTSYDRRKTVEVDLDKRERIELRNNIIAELNKEYGDINAEIDAIYKELEQEKADLIRKQEEHKAEHNKLYQAILLEKENAQKDHETKLSGITDETEKAIVVKEFNSYLAKLDKRAKAEENIANTEMFNLAKAEAKYLSRIKKLNDKQQFIKDEIARIEREIEAIAAEEEIMWNEYRRAKEQAKKQKLEYMAEKRNEKQTNKNLNNQTENSETEEQKSDNTEVDVIVPDDKEDK